MKRLVIVAIALDVSSAVVAGESVSAAFTLDLHCESSGEVFPWDGGTEVWGMSSRWVAMTTLWASDVNGDGIPDWWEESFGVAVGSLCAQDDADGDGFSNLFEYNAKMNPLVPDVLVAMNAVSDAHCVDTDGLADSDGSFFGLDEVWGMSALFSADTAGWERDSDLDGLPDWWERIHGLNPFVADASLDLDGDGRTNLEEYNAGTNPVMADDWSLSSGAPVRSFVCDTLAGFIAGESADDEAFAVVKITRPFVCDTGGLYYDWDGDGIPNWWEARYSRDGSKTGLAADRDADGDGMSNYAEFVAYTNPTNGMSRFTVEITRVQSVAARAMLGVGPAEMAVRNVRLMAPEDGVTCSLRWQSSKGRMYSVYSTDDLSAGLGVAPDAEIAGTGEMVEWTAQFAGRERFFKVTVRLADDY